MSTSLPSAAVSLKIQWNQQATNTGAQNTAQTGSWNFQLKFANGGQTAGKANEFVQLIRTLGSSANETLDLTTGLSNLVGNTNVDFTTIRCCVFALLSAAQTGPDAATVGTAASYLTVGNAASNQAFAIGGTVSAPNGFLGASTNTLIVPNGGFIAAGVASALGFTVDSTHKSLKIANGDGALSAKYVISLIGTNT